MWSAHALERTWRMLYNDHKTSDKNIVEERPIFPKQCKNHPKENKIIRATTQSVKIELRKSLQ